MRTKDYVEKYGLQQGENAIFDKQGLLKDLNREFIALIESYGENLTYPIFHNLIKQVNTKFWAISNKRRGLPFTSGYWNVFYMEYILPQRAKYFPEIHKELEEKRLNRPQYK